MAVALDEAPAEGEVGRPAQGPKPMLRGRAFYESLGSPKYVVAPMVDQSEFAWRMLTRSFMPSNEPSSLLAYTPMFHAKLFSQGEKYRYESFPSANIPATDDGQASESKLDGNPSIDRPLFVQFCANDPELLLQSAKLVQAHCDAVDLNLGCPQGIARSGHYGAFLQEDWGLIHRLINTLHMNLDIPVTAKIRVQETREKTLEYAKMILSAGASIITVHGRRREQKGHNTGIANWSMIRFLRDNLPPETVIFANGNILQHGDIERCLKATGADAVMSAEGNLHDPSIFSIPPPVGDEGREYWRGRDGKGGYRIDAVMRRYMDILYRYALRQPVPERPPLFLPSDPRPEGGFPSLQEVIDSLSPSQTETEAKKKKKKRKGHIFSPNFSAMQPHMFDLLKPLITKHVRIRAALARCSGGDIPAYENVLLMVEAAVREGLIEYEEQGGEEQEPKEAEISQDEIIDDPDDSRAAVARCARPWWVCQPYIRPLPKEAIAIGSLILSKKEKKKLAESQAGELPLDEGPQSKRSKLDEEVTTMKDQLTAG